MRGKDPLLALVLEDEAQRKRRGTLDTPREILQQPELWRDTAARAVALGPRVRGIHAGVRDALFAGAGSSLHAAELLAQEARGAFGRGARAASSTDLLLSPESYFERGRPGVLYTLSRSGESPESVESVRRVAKLFPRVAQVGITCNPSGRLAKILGSHPRGACLVLDPRAYDRGLATTSSMTSTVVGGYGLLAAENPGPFLRRVERLARAAQRAVRSSESSEQWAARRPERVVFLGTGALETAAREAAHKVLEMTDGEVQTMARSPLEFRHGPIAFITRKTMVCGLVSPDPRIAPYDLDLLGQVEGSRQAGSVLFLPPGETWRESPPVRPSRIGAFGACDAALLGIVQSQMLALFISLKRGYTPDRPGSRGLVNPVVQGVTVHPRR